MQVWKNFHFATHCSKENEWKFEEHQQCKSLTFADKFLRLLGKYPFGASSCKFLFVLIRKIPVDSTTKFRPHLCVNAKFAAIGSVMCRVRIIVKKFNRSFLIIGKNFVLILK